MTRIKSLDIFQGHNTNTYSLAMTILDWLNYINRISVGDLIDEDSLKYPITEYLERKEKQVCSQQETHPVFKKKRIDIAWDELSKIQEIESGKEPWGNYIELKYVKHISITNVTDDLFRLFYIKKRYPSSKCYFLVFGEKSLFKVKFHDDIIERVENIEYNHDVIENQEIEYRGEQEDSFAHWFTLQLENPKKEIYCDGTNPTSMYYDFLNRDKGTYYFRNENEKEDKINFCTKIVERRSNSDKQGSGFSIAIWEILLHTE